LFLGIALRRRFLMDLLTAVAVSMLPVSRLRAAATFKVLRQTDQMVGLADVVEAVGSPGVELSEVLAHAQDAIDSARRLGFAAIPWFDPRYPALLTCTEDPPPVLWGLGITEAATRPAVAVIGSRAATPYALQVGRRLAAELADRGIVVVSGLARGVDSAAHEGSLDAGGATVAVTGCGLDRVYPCENTGLARRIAGNGLLLSELAAGAAPLPEHFPLRNRIISGISLAVVVVEANEKSGSLITAACAARQGRDVMAVPGSVLSGRNRGSHSLLKDGAKVVETADDILEELGWTSHPPVERVGNTRAKSLSQDPLLSRMEVGEVYGLDDLAEATGTGAAKLLPRLMELELLGYVEAPSAGRFIRKVLIT
jgi:DNA processing protein